MKVSVVITTYNRAEMVQEALQSVLKQSHAADEVIVVDDGSHDDTLQRLAPLAPPVQIIHQAHAGVSAARNRGIRASRNDWIAFLDSDDLWRPDKLERQRQALAAQPDCAICYSDEEWRRFGRWMNQGKKHRKYSGWIYEHCLPLCIISPSSVLIHRRLFATAGLFDENLPACEDYDLWLRIACRYPVLFIPERLIVKRAGGWTQLSAQHSLDRYRILSLQKMLHAGTLSAEQAQQTQTMLREKCRIYALGCRKHGREQDVHWAEDLVLKNSQRG